MNKKQAIFWTDSALVPLFLLTFYTGVKLHVAGHGEDHAVWHYWAVFHALAGFVFTLFGTIHVKDHRGWYKGLKNRGVNGRARMPCRSPLSWSLRPVWRYCFGEMGRIPRSDFCITKPDL